MINFINQIRNILLLLLILVNLGCFENYYGFTGNLVYKNDTEPAVGIKVYIHQPDNCLLEDCSKVDTVKTNEKGSFKFYDFGIEKITIKIEVEGFKEIKETIFKDGKQLKDKFVLELECLPEITNEHCIIKALGTCINTTTSVCTEVPEADCEGDNLEFTAESNCPVE